MKFGKLIRSLSLAITFLIVVSSIQADFFGMKARAKKKACQKSCQTAKEKAIDDCTMKMNKGKKPEAVKEEKDKKKEVDPKCQLPAEAAEGPCVSECVSKAN